MLRSAGIKLTTAAVVFGVLAALAPATPALASVAASPLPGTGPGMAYDAADGQVVLFGGSAGRTWTWDGSAWTRRTPAHSPPPSGSYYRYGLAYDAARSQVVLFGGPAGDTWTWDGTDWTERFPAHSPSPRQDMGMASDAARGEVVLFGGYNDLGFLRSTWTWDGTDWTHRTPAHSPPSRYLPGMAYDAARSEVVLFGGEASNGNALFLADTWTWNGTDWTKRSPAHSPFQRLDVGMAYDAHGQVVLFGGSCSDPCADTWTWDGTDWTQRPAGTISVFRRSGPPGDGVEVQGWSFLVGENVKLSFVDSSQGTTYLTQVQANPFGGLVAFITIPATATPGAQRVKAKGLISGRIATVAFTVT
jgi:hypothetical protein